MFLLGGCPRMGAGKLGVLFGRQSERVPAHRMHHAIAPHPTVAANDIRGGIPFRVADVQPIPAGIGEHVEHVLLGPFGQSRGRERAVLFPVFLPLRFNNSRIVARHGRSSR